MVLPLHFKHEGLEAQRNEGSYPRSPSNLGVEPRLQTPMSSPLVHYSFICTHGHS